MVPKKPESMTTMDKVQQFFILHGEKLGFSVVLLVLAWCLTTIFTVETYQHQPEELVRDVQNKKQSFQNNDPTKDESFQQLQVFRYDAQARQSLAFHVTDIGPFDRGTNVGKKRPDPELIPLADLQARSKQAIVIYRPPRGSQLAAGDGNGAGAPVGPAGNPGGKRPPGAPADIGGPGGIGGEGLAEFAAGGGQGIGGGPPLGPAGGGEGGAGAQAPIAANTDPELRYMVVITGRIPLKKQLEIYRKAFKDCRITDPNRDYPSYFTFLVERRDLTAGEQKWKRINVRAFLEQQVPQWYSATEVVDAKHVVPLQVLRGRKNGWTGFTSPLPLLADESWGPEATANQIPLLSDLGTREAAEPAQNDSTDEMFPDDLFPDQGLEQQQPNNGSPGRTPPSRPGITGPLGGLTSPGQVPGRFPGGGSGPLGGLPGSQGMGPPTRVGGPSGMGGPLGPGGAPEMGLEMGAGTGASSGALRGTGSSWLLRRPQDDILLRFLDLDVEPGHEYVYRVQIILYNPNYGINARFLVNRDSAKRRFLETQWVELPEPVRVTVTREVIAGPVRRSPVRDRQSVMVVVRDPDNGAQILSELRIYRGHLLNKTVREVFRKHPTHNSVEKLRDYPIQTNILVLDFMGGRSVPGVGSRVLNMPSQVLVMHEDGRLEVRQEISEDVDAHYDLARKRLAQLAKLAKETEGGSDQTAGQGSGPFFGPSGSDQQGGPAAGNSPFDEFQPNIGTGGSSRKRPRRRR